MRSPPSRKAGAAMWYLASVYSAKRGFPVNPQEWSILSALFAGVVSLLVYIWRDSLRRDKEDKLEIRASLDSFSRRIDGAIDDIRARLSTQASRFELLGERLAVLESQRRDAEKDADGIRGELHQQTAAIQRLADQVAQLRGRLGVSSPSGGIAASPPPPRPR